MIEPELSTLYPPGARPVSDATAVPVSRLLVQWIAELTDAQLAGLVATVVFLLSAWPLLLVVLPPLQDLPNHLATAHVIEHPELFPQFAFNGFFNSNCLLTLWFHLLGDQRLFLAARLFAALSIAVNALALPAFFLHFRGRRAMPVCMLFAWPLVHGFFLSMGFLNFVVSFGLSLLLLIVMDRQQEQPTWRRGVGIALLACFIWYAHVFPLVVAAALVICAILQRSGSRARAAAPTLLPLVPAAVLSLVTAQKTLVGAHGASAVLAPLVSYQNVWDLVTHLWRDASGALTYWGSMSLVPALLLPVFAWRGRHSPRRLFSGAVIAGLVVAYGALPVMASSWGYLNCRLVPFIWVGLALCVPTTLPRRVPAVLLACAISFSAVLGLDYTRLDADRAEFTAGVNAVPRGATLMPLVFARQKTADFVASLGHAWGYYTAEKDAMAPVVFPAERASPVPWASSARQSVAPTFEQFAERYATPARVCKALGQPAVDAFCTAAWRDAWDGFWKEVQPRFTHLLTWAMPPEARGLIPPAYRLTFAAGDLEIYAREPPAGAGGQLTSVR